MSRPLRDVADDALLKESHHLSDLLDRVNASIHVASTQIEMFYVMVKSKLDADVIQNVDQFPAFSTAIAATFADQRSRIEDRLQQIDSELEEREIEREEASDRTGGVAA